MKKDLTEIVMIVDRSGSMNSIKADAQGGFNEFIKKQKEVEGEARITLVEFDHRIETVYDNVDIHEVKNYNLMPSGTTALLDAIGTTVSNVGIRLSNTKEEDRPSKVMVCIITDGQENASHEYTKEKIKTMIELQRSTYSWEFVFIGANMDAFGEASQMGVAYAASYDATSKGIRSAFAYSSNLTKSYRGASGACAMDSFDLNAKLDS